MELMLRRSLLHVQSPAAPPETLLRAVKPEPTSPPWSPPRILESTWDGLLGCFGILLLLLGCLCGLLVTNLLSIEFY